MFLLNNIIVVISSSVATVNVFRSTHMCAYTRTQQRPINYVYEIQLLKCARTRAFNSIKTVAGPELCKTNLITTVKTVNKTLLHVIIISKIKNDVIYRQVFRLYGSQSAE